MAVRVTEHQVHRVCCPGCGATPAGQLPATVAASAFGPRLQAAIVCLSVRNRISRRDVVELCEQLFSSRISVGSIDAILARAGDALAAPCEDLLGRVRSAGAVNMDETGWRLRGSQRALWGMFSERHAIFEITSSRHDDHAKALLGPSSAIVTSDRWWAYTTYRPDDDRSAGAICNATSSFTPKAAAATSRSARLAWRSARSCSGPGRSTSTLVIAASSSAASRCCSATSKRSCASTPQSTPVTARAGASPARC